MGLFYLAELVLHQQRPHSVQHAGRTAADRRTAGGLDADQPRRGVGESREDPGGVRATADARDHHVGDPDAELDSCVAASRPMMLWNSRTIHGKGCGPITEPMQ